MKISVIMPSFLGDFDGCAPNRNQKFIRSVNSFISQTWADKELIIISDGCVETNQRVEKYFKSFLKSGEIKLIKLSFQHGFRGVTRQQGIDAATGEILINLDTDDYYLPYHLRNIALDFDTDKLDWVYFNHITKPDNIRIEYWNDCKLEEGKICNANYAWKKGIDVTWNNCDGKQDNKLFTKQLMDNFPHRKKIYGCGYVVGHISFQHVKNEDRG